MPDSLATLRDELRARLGMGAMAATSGPTIALLNSFLARAQSFIYWRYEHESWRRFWDLPITAAAGTLYNYPANAANETPEPRRIRSVHIVVGSQWIPMYEGIPPVDYTLVGLRYPSRYARRNQFEVWPAPDTNYTVKIEGLIALLPFALDADVATVDSDLVLNLALGYGKAHYRHADAKLALEQAMSQTRTLAGANVGNKRYIPGGGPRPPMVRPKLV